MSGKAEYVLAICDEMRHAPIPRHRHDRELLTAFANRLEVAYIHKMHELAKAANTAQDGKNAMTGVDEVNAYLDAKVDTLMGKVKVREDNP